MSPKAARNLAMVLISVLTSHAGFPTTSPLVGTGAAPYRCRRRPLLAGPHVPVDEPLRVLPEIFVRIACPL
jgi:hypothetical protein